MTGRVDDDGVYTASLCLDAARSGCDTSPMTTVKAKQTRRIAREPQVTDVHVRPRPSGGLRRVRLNHDRRLVSSSLS